MYSVQVYMYLYMYNTRLASQHMPIPRVQAHLYSVLVHTGEGYSVRRRQIKFCEFIQSISAVGIIRTGRSSLAL